MRSLTTKAFYYTILNIIFKYHMNFTFFEISRDLNPTYPYPSNKTKQAER